MILAQVGSVRNMESLTERLSFLMKQVFDDQIDQLIIKNRQEKEFAKEREQKFSVLQSMKFVKNKRIVDPNKHESRIRRSMGNKMYDTKPNDDNKQNHPISLKNIWGGPKPSKVNCDKDEESKDNGTELESSAKSKFLKAAKLAVLISQVKKDHNICTCESLDALCKIHDH